MHWIALASYILLITVFMIFFGFYTDINGEIVFSMGRAAGGAISALIVIFFYVGIKFMTEIFYRKK